VSQLISEAEDQTGQLAGGQLLETKQLNDEWIPVYLLLLISFCSRDLGSAQSLAVL
jgi:hypothetical protein